MSIDPAKRRPGRPAKHLDDADRAAAYRQRRADKAAAGEMALTILAHPTLKLVEVLVARLVRAGRPRGEAIGDIRAAVDRGIARGFTPAAPYGAGRQTDLEDFLATLAIGDSPGR